MNIFVGNLSFDAVEADVKKLFEGFGKVDSVVIVMQKDGKKSRGFAFVEMLNEEEAQAAIVALNEKEFMGRVINVEAGRPKSESDGEDRKKRQKPADTDVESQQQGREVDGGEEVNYNKAHFNQSRPRRDGYNRYKEGRRSRSYSMRRETPVAGEQVASGRTRQENPMRWRKHSESSPRPWRKSYGESRSFQGNQGERRPWGKPSGESRQFGSSAGERRPWGKPSGESRSFGRPAGESRPWRRSESGQRPPWKRTEGESRPWKSSEGEARTWKKAEGEARPWKRPEGGESRPWKKTEGEARPWKKTAGGSSSWQKPKSGPGFRSSRKPNTGKRSWNKS